MVLALGCLWVGPCPGEQVPPDASREHGFPLCGLSGPNRSELVRWPRATVCCGSTQDKILGNGSALGESGGRYPLRIPWREEGAGLFKMGHTGKNLPLDGPGGQTCRYLVATVRGLRTRRSWTRGRAQAPTGTDSLSLGGSKRSIFALGCGCHHPETATSEEGMSFRNMMGHWMGFPRRGGG